jgi:hypothetical protein
MIEEQEKTLNHLKDIQENLGKDWLEYWHNYSSFDTWQFWVNVTMLILPLVVLYFFMDRRRAFHLGFYGFSIHVLAVYIDATALRYGLWEYPYKAIPFLPISFGLDSSLIPVVYMLVYQWTLNNKKNYYLYTFITSVCFAFIFKPILSLHELIRLTNGTNYIHLFVAYLLVALLPKWLTNVFIHFEKEGNPSSLAEKLK